MKMMIHYIGAEKRIAEGNGEDESGEQRRGGVKGPHHQIQKKRHEAADKQCRYLQELDCVQVMHTHQCQKYRISGRVVELDVPHLIGQPEIHSPDGQVGRRVPTPIEWNRVEPDRLCRHPRKEDYECGHKIALSDLH
jgi:hypothetical protein